MGPQVVLRADTGGLYPQELSVEEDTAVAVAEGKVVGAEGKVVGGGEGEERGGALKGSETKGRQEVCPMPHPGPSHPGGGLPG